MQINHRLYNGSLYCILSGELDENSAKYARLELDELFSNTDCRQVIIDLSELEFMDSTGIGVLIGRYKILKGRHIPAYICNPSSQAERIFNMTGLYQIMPKIS
jgi:stage II sporulation protein AA (anti-sigma F factor antagonist)